MKIETGKFVALHYELEGFESDPNEMEAIEKTTSERPFSFIFGMGTVLPEFEKHLEGLTQGDKFDFQLAPSQAYGEIEDDMIITLPKKVFCDQKGNFLSQYVKEGEQVPLQAQNGQIVHATVSAITENEVVCDLNHPLAGMTLHFKGEVAEVREPNEEDKIAYMRESCGEEEGGHHCCGKHKGEGHHCCHEGEEGGEHHCCHEGEDGGEHHCCHEGEDGDEHHCCKHK